MITAGIVLAIILAFLLGLTISINNLDLCIICFLICYVCLCLVAIITIRAVNDLPSGKRVKVKELKHNTILYITTTDRYSKGDSVFVNIKTLKIDPLDSTAMKCVVIENLIIN